MSSHTIANDRRPAVVVSCRSGSEKVKIFLDPSFPDPGNFAGIEEPMEEAELVVTVIPAGVASDTPPTYWQDYGKRGMEASIRVKRKIPCASCSRLFHANGMNRHMAVCTGPEKIGATTKRFMGHDHCACGRIKSRSGRTCFRCEDRDLAVFAELDAMIAAGVGARETGII